MAKFMDQALTSKNSSLAEPLEVTELKRKIAEKKKILEELAVEVEGLKIDLTVIMQEFNVRIKRLYLKLDELDLEILKYTKIKEYLKKGLPEKEAAEKIEDEAMEERRRKIHEETENIHRDEEIVQRKKQIPEAIKKELHALWLKLCRRFHPDLTTDETDKTRREEIMKQINRAYENGDLETLKAIGEERFAEEKPIADLGDLKKQLSAVQSAIKKHEEELAKLKLSAWFVWKINLETAKKENRDLFAELENKILETIAQKEIVLSGLKKQYGQK